MTVAFGPRMRHALLRYIDDNYLKTIEPSCKTPLPPSFYNSTIFIMESLNESGFKASSNSPGNSPHKTCPIDSPKNGHAEIDELVDDIDQNDVINIQQHAFEQEQSEFDLAIAEQFEDLNLPTQLKP